MNTWNSVIEDMQERNIKGLNTYKVPLHPHNGRNSLQDAYEEALDLSVYLKNEIREKQLNTEKTDCPEKTDYPEKVCIIHFITPIDNKVIKDVDSIHKDIDTEGRIFLKVSLKNGGYVVIPLINILYYEYC